MSLLLMCCGSIFADEATFVFNTPEGLQALGIAEPEAGAGTDLGTTTYTVNGVSLTATDGSTNTRIWKAVNKTTGVTTLNLRVYKSNATKPAGTLTLSAGDKYITEIEFAGTVEMEADGGSLDEATKTWKGSAKTVVFTATATNQLNTIKVTYQASAGVTKKDAALAFSAETVNAVVGEPFTAPTLSKATTAAVTYSSTNAKVATVDATSGAVTIVGAGTAKIRATVEENEEYYGDQAEYQIIATEPVKSEVTLPYSDLSKGQGSFTIDDINVPDGKYVWTWVSSNSYMKGSGLKDTETESDLNSPIIDLTGASKPVMTFSQCINKYFGNYANEAQLIITTLEGGAISDQETYALEAPAFEEGETWSKWKDESIDLSAYVGMKIQVTFKYKSTTTNYGTWEIKNFSVEDENAQPAAKTVENIAGLSALNAKDEATLTLTDAEVAKKWTSKNGNTQIYLRDATGAIEFYVTNQYAAIAENFVEGGIVNGTIDITYDIYNKMQEIVPNENTNVSNLTFQAPTGAPEAKAIAITDVAANLHNLVAIKDVTIEMDAVAARGNNVTAQATTFYAASGSDRIRLFNGFHDKQFDDFSPFMTGTVNIKGIVMMSESEYELYPIEISSPTAINSIKADKLNADAPMFNLAGQRVSKNFKGVVIQNGRKFVNK